MVISANGHPAGTIKAFYEMAPPVALSRFGIHFQHEVYFERRDVLYSYSIYGICYAAGR